MNGDLRVKQQYAVVLNKRQKPIGAPVVQLRKNYMVSDHSPPRDPPRKLRSKKSTTPSWIAFLLVCFLVSQPIYVAMATELEPAESEVAKGVSEEAAEEVVEENMEEQDLIDEEEEVVEEEKQEEDLDDTQVLDEQRESSQVLEEVENTDKEIGSELTDEDIEVSTSSATATPEVDMNATTETVATTTPEAEDDDTEETTSTGGSSGGGSGSSEVEEEVATSTPKTFSSTSTVATTTTTSDATGGGGTALDEVVASSTTPQAQIPATSTAETITIGDRECMTLEDGALYCIKPGEAASDDPSEIGFGKVVARVDEQGDREIYLVEGGKTVQLTRNDYDDFAPIFDEVTLRVVWHAMIDDRLQIMLHDRSNGQTRQLTDTSYNNSNPYVYGDTVVWQAWIDDNWEIFHATDLDRDEPIVRQITNNSRHDMFPRVFDSYITWQAQTSDSWHVVVYDQATKRFSYVKKEGDGKYENPRFALLMDNRNEDGDVRVVGFDVAGDEEIPLTPFERSIPEPVTPNEDTGDAALPSVTASSTIKTGERKNGDDNN